MNTPEREEHMDIEQTLRQSLREEAAMGDRSETWWSRAVHSASAQPQRRSWLAGGVWSRARLVPALAMTFALVLVVSGGLVFASAAGLLRGTGGTEGSDPPLLPHDEASPGSAAMCLEVYSPETIGNRAFAFDGTVKGIEIRTVPGVEEEGYQEYWVTFSVNRWFKGGEGDTVSIWLSSLWLAESDTFGPENELIRTGSRLLVSGEPRDGGQPLEDPIAWTACGFTKARTPEMAQEWADALAQ